MKRFKKILAAITTAALSAVSLCNLFSISAASNSYSTYRLYFDVEANSGVKKYAMSMGYWRTLINCGVKPGTLGDNVRGGGSGSAEGGRSCGYTYENTSNLTAGGILFTMAFYTSSDSFWDHVSNFQGTATNSAGVVLSDRVNVSTILVGDINQDGNVDSKDTALLKNYLAGSANLTGDALRAADTNGDYVIDTKDREILVQYLANDIEHF